MRRPTTVSLQQQASLLADLLGHAPAATLAHHGAEVERFLFLLHDGAVVTHSVEPGVVPPRTPHPDELLGPGTGPGRVVAARARVRALLGAIVDRRIRIAARTA